MNSDASRILSAPLGAAAIDQSADAIVITDAGGRSSMPNPAFTALTGDSSEEAIGQSPEA